MVSVIHRARHLVALAVLALLAFAPLTSASAQTPLAGFNADNTGTGTLVWGVKVPVQVPGSFGNIAFNFYSDLTATTPAAYGTLFVLGSEYLGAPDALSSATPGFLGQSVGIVNDQYVFDPTFTLTGGQTYYLYSNAPGLIAGSGNGNVPGGIYGAADPTAPFIFVAGTEPDFLLTSEVPTVQSINGFAGATTVGSSIPGQQIPVLGTGRYDHLAFNFYADSAATQPSAFGTLYLLDTEYLGAPAGLGSAPGLIATSQAIVNGRYVFDPTVALTAGQTYYAYADATGPISASLNAPGAVAYGSFDALTPFQVVSDASFNYQLTGHLVTTTPEGSSLALCGTGLLALGGVLRRRPRARDA